MSQWPRILMGVAIAAVGCGEDLYFQVALQEPPVATCPALQFDSYAVLTWQGTDEFLGCVEGPCSTGSHVGARECLLGVETPVVEPGRATRIKVMLFSGPPNQPPMWCGEGGTPEIDFDTPKVDIAMECADSCGSVGCQPGTCLTERNALCP